MGGQACVFYGAAEFSRDTDLLVLAEAANLEHLQAALRELHAECIAVPPFAPDYLERGHAVHFRCHHPEAADMRVDMMAKLRGVEPFPVLWERRTILTDNDGVAYDSDFPAGPGAGEEDSAREGLADAATAGRSDTT